MLTLPVRIANKYKQRQPLETPRPQPHFGNIFSDAVEERGEGGCRLDAMAAANAEHTPGARRDAGEAGCVLC